MSAGRRALVYGVAAVVGFLFAFLLLPGGVGEERGPAEGVDVQAKDGALTRTIAARAPSEADGAADSVEPETAGEPRVGRGGNPRAREIAEALSTPAHQLVGRTSPVWVQIRRVLPAEEEWGDLHEQVDSMLDALRAAARDTTLDLPGLIEAQLSLVNRLEREQLGGAVEEALEELTARLNSVEAG